MQSATQVAGSVKSAGKAGVILSAHGLVKDYGGVRAIDGLDIEIPAGEIRCIIGPNGAGKSTLFKLLMGIERPTEGQVYFHGRDVTRLPPHQRARLGLGIKFQNMVVYKELTVFQNLFIPLRQHHARRDIPEAIRRLLADLHLSGTEETVVGSLSHGQQQWLAIGMSLALEPAVLLLDEPAAGLSAEETRETGLILHRLNAQGMTIVIIEHDMGFIRSLQSPTTVLHYGRTFMHGSFEEVERSEDVHRIYLGKV